MLLCYTTLHYLFCFMILCMYAYKYMCRYISVNKLMVSKIQQAMHSCMKSISYVSIKHTICDREIRSLKQVYIWEFALCSSRLSNQKRSDQPMFTDVYAALTFSFKLSIPSKGPLILQVLAPQLVSELSSFHSSLQISSICGFELQGVARGELHQWNSCLLWESASQFSYWLLGGTWANSSC